MTTLALFAAVGAMLLALLALLFADEAVRRAEKAEEAAEQASSDSLGAKDDLDLFETELDQARERYDRAYNDLRVWLSTLEGRQEIADFIAAAPEKKAI